MGIFRVRTTDCFFIGIKNLFNDCQPKTIDFRVLTINLGHLHG